MCFLAWSMINVSTYDYYQKMPSSWPVVILSIHLLFLVACCIASHSQVVQVPSLDPKNLSTFFPLLDLSFGHLSGNAKNLPIPSCHGTRNTMFDFDDLEEQEETTTAPPELVAEEVWMGMVTWLVVGV